MNAARIFLALILTVLAALQWRTVQMRIELDRHGDEVIAELALELGGPVPPDEVAKIRAIVAKAPSYDAVLAPALSTTGSCILVWALSIWAIRRSERRDNVLKS